MAANGTDAYKATLQFVGGYVNTLGGVAKEGIKAGAPLNEDELSILDDIYDEVKPYLRPEGIEVIENEGKYNMDADGDWVTPLVNNRECAKVKF